MINSKTIRQDIKNYVALIILSFFITGNLYGQSGTTITGRVTDSLQIPLEFVTVALLSTTDSSIVKSTITNVEGNFSFNNCVNSKYTIVVSAMGFKKTYSNELIISSQSKVICNISLIPEGRLIKEVVIVGKQPVIEMKADKTIINVSSNINATGTNALEILRKSPGIRVMNEDGIQINGKNGMLLYLDGNQVNLSAKEQTELLKNIQSSNIGTIEIITNPSSRYDAAGNAGIIHIRTKKNGNNGFNGNLTTTGALSNYNPKYDAAAALNYRNKGINIYGNYGYYTGKNQNKTTYFRKQVTPDGLLTNFDQYFTNNSDNKNNNFKAGLDLIISPLSSFGIIVDGNLAKRNAISNSNTLISHTPGLTDSSLVASNNQNRTSNILSYNTNYRYADSTGKEFTINGNYLTFKLRDGSYQPNTYYNGNSQFLHSNIYANNAATDIGIISLKSDYQQKLWNGVFSAGAKWMRTQADNDFIFYNVINDNYIPDQGKTNRFLYKEYVTAAYIDYHIKNKKWELQTGLRAEQTIARGNLKSLSENQGEVVNNSYLNLFPNIIFTYYPNTNNTVTLLYNKRIDRPAYQDLNPFVYVQDEYSFLKGNPFLLPQVTETYKIAHIFKQMLTTSFSYSETKDYIVSYRDTIMGGRTYQTNINIDNQRNYNLSVFLQLSPKTWWDFNSSLNAFHQTVNGKAGNTRLNMSQNSWSFTGSNNFRLPDNWSAEISFYYNSKYLDAPAIVNSQWSTDLGIQKKNIKVFRYNPIDSIRFI